MPRFRLVLSLWLWFHLVDQWSFTEAARSLLAKPPGFFVPKFEIFDSKGVQTLKESLLIDHRVQKKPQSIRNLGP
jgi:hypothetical protein